MLMIIIVKRTCSTNVYISQEVKYLINIYLDESGDLGFSEKSSKYFVISLLITKNHKQIDNCIKRIRQRKLKPLAPK